MRAAFEGKVLSWIGLVARRGKTFAVGLALILVSTCAASLSACRSCADDPTSRPRATASAITSSPGSAPSAEVSTATKQATLFASRLADAWSGQDPKTATALFANDGVLSLEGYPDDRRGSEAIERTFADVFSTFKSARLTVGRVWVGKSASAIELLFGGVMREDLVHYEGRPDPVRLPGMSTRDRRVGVLGAGLVTFDEGGLVRTAALYLDAMTWAGQIAPALLHSGVGVRPVAVTVPAGTGVFESKDTPEETTNMAAQDTLLAAADRHDADGVLGLLADGSTYDDFRAPVVTNKEGVRTGLGATFSAFPDWHVASKAAQFAAGDYVVTEHVDTGTFRGTFLGHEPNGKAFTSHGLFVAEYKGGKVRRGYAYGDASEILGQLGIVKVYPPDAGSSR